METKKLLNHEASRMAAFRLLSDCYFLPDPGLSEKLENLESNMVNVCQPAVKWVQNMRKEFEAGADLEPLKVEFAKLFVGPYQLSAAPYGSVYLEGERKMMGDSTLDVRNRYREAGLDTANNFKDAPDHIGAELEFMYYLIFKEIVAFANSDIGTAIDFIQKQRSFLEDHLMAWVPEFAKSIIESAESPFYPNLAKTTKAFLRENYQIVCSVLDSKQLNSEKQTEANSLRV
ncbi:MAG: molecular chaperone TorD family protein [Deltaproteobacteria bacterium]|nr:molecular chaperone TorD family protein [Deltaproteobacteria bacterium]